jgi:hypothetical protein
MTDITGICSNVLLFVLCIQFQVKSSILTIRSGISVTVDSLVRQNGIEHHSQPLIPEEVFEPAIAPIGGSL